MNDKQFVTVIATMNALWQPAIKSEAELTVWENMIGGMEYEPVSKAIMVLAKTSQYRPTVAAINETIAELTGTKRMSAEEAWQIARPCVSAYVTRERIDRLPEDVRKALYNAGRASYLGSLPEEKAHRMFKSAWDALMEKQHREQMKQIGSGLLQIGDGK